MIHHHLGLVHPAIIPHLPTSLLRSTHLVVCALRGRCWGSQQPKLRFVSMHGWSKLHAYHLLILREMKIRGYNTAPRWKFPGYRGRKVAPWPLDTKEQASSTPDTLGYPEHTPDAYRACLELLRRKVPGSNWSIPDLHRLEQAPERIT